MIFPSLSVRFCAFLFCFPAAFSSAQGRHASLTPAEADQLRDTAMEPDQRLKLFVKFTRARLASLEQMRSDPKGTNRGKQTHDQLEEFLALYDELNDNVDTYTGRKNDIRKPLKAVIAGRSTMKPNTAIAFVLAAVSLWLQRGSPAHPLERRVALGCATAVAAIGLVTLAEYLFAWDPGIDRWIFPKPPDAVTPFPGRMGINTATSFCLRNLRVFCD